MFGSFYLTIEHGQQKNAILTQIFYLNNLFVFF